MSREVREGIFQMEQNRAPNMCVSRTHMGLDDDPI